MPSSIVLVGPMGAGKSTIGKLLAAHLQLPFLDVDHMVVEASGADIPWIFDVEGEQGFRQRETQSLALALDSSCSVVATGGGIVTQKPNIKLLEKNGFVVFLNASIEQQVQRTSKDKNRPLLQNDNPREVLEKLMQQRKPLYESIADMVVDTDQYRPRDVAVMIAEHWQSLHS